MNGLRESMEDCIRADFCNLKIDSAVIKALAQDLIEFRKVSGNERSGGAFRDLLTIGHISVISIGISKILVIRQPGCEDEPLTGEKCKRVCHPII